MTLGDVIKAYREQHAMSMDKFASVAGISKAYVSMLERNRTQRGDEPSPSIDIYRSIARAIGIDADELIRMVDGNVSICIPRAENVIPLPNTYKVPLVGTIACGAPILAVENAEETVDVPGFVHADFALRCKGDSMINARIFDGDIVYIRSQIKVEAGQIAAVRIDDEATLKKVYYTPGSDRITLRACNPLYPDMVYEGETLNQIEIIGLAVGFYSAIRDEQQ